MDTVWPLLLFTCLVTLLCLVHGQIVIPVYPSLLEIPENVPLGWTIGNVTDGRTQPPFIQSVVYLSPPDHRFNVSQNGAHTWDIKLNELFDHELNTNYAATFIAKAPLGNFDSQFTITIVVKDVNDNPPQFQNLPYNAQVKENVIPGAVVFDHINATDRDSESGNKIVRYSAEGDSSEDPSKTFMIDPNTGDISLIRSLDYEQTTFYHYKITAKDSGVPSLSSTTDLFITVMDVQDSPPVFLNSPYIASVLENATMNFTVLTVKAIDGDRALPNNINYNITSTNCGGLFSMDPTNGRLSVHGSLDYEQPAVKDNDGVCTLTIQATEQSRPGHPQEGNFTATATAAITISDVNDNPPVFNVQAVTASVNENSPLDTPLELSTSLNVADADSGDNSNIKLSIASDGDAFGLVTSRIQSSGAVLLRVKNSTYLDFEKRQSVTVQISATDGFNDAPHGVTATISINNVNEFTPRFNESQFSFNVQEDTPVGTTVAHIAAHDGDAGSFGHITYSLSNSDIFAIGTYTGVVTTNSTQIDREQLDRYYVRVIATDGGGLEQTTVLDVTIGDINDNAPVFVTNEYESTLQENSSALKRPIIVQALDADQAGTANSLVAYSLIGTVPAGLERHFRLDPSTGQLIVADALDFGGIQWSEGQAPGVVSVRVVASDQGSPRLSSTVSVTIVLIDKDGKDLEFSNINKETHGTKSDSLSLAGLAGSIVGAGALVTIGIVATICWLQRRRAGKTKNANDAATQYPPQPDKYSVEPSSISSGSTTSNHSSILPPGSTKQSEVELSDTHVNADLPEDSVEPSTVSPGSPSNQSPGSSKRSEDGQSHRSVNAVLPGLYPAIPEQNDNCSEDGLYQENPKQTRF